MRLVTRQKQHLNSAVFVVQQVVPCHNTVIVCRYRWSQAANSESSPRGRWRALCRHGNCCSNQVHHCFSQYGGLLLSSFCAIVDCATRLTTLLVHWNILFHEKTLERLLWQPFCMHWSWRQLVLRPSPIGDITKLDGTGKPITLPFWTFVELTSFVAIWVEGTASSQADSGWKTTVHLIHLKKRTLRWRNSVNPGRFRLGNNSSSNSSLTKTNLRWRNSVNPSRCKLENNSSSEQQQCATLSENLPRRRQACSWQQPPYIKGRKGSRLPTLQGRKGSRPAAYVTGQERQQAAYMTGQERQQTAHITGQERGHWLAFVTQVAHHACANMGNLHPPDMGEDPPSDPQWKVYPYHLLRCHLQHFWIMLG